MWYTYPIEYHSALKYGEILPFEAAWINLENSMLSKIS